MMTSHSLDRPVSALRARMIEDMRVRGFSEKTRNVRESPEVAKPATCDRVTD